jgi:hypothetical protein
MSGGEREACRRRPGLRECPGWNHKVSMSTSACIDTITVGERSLMMRG